MIQITRPIIWADRHTAAWIPRAIYVTRMTWSRDLKQDTWSRPDLGPVSSRDLYLWLTMPATRSGRTGDAICQTYPSKNNWSLKQSNPGPYMDTVLRWSRYPECDRQVIWTWVGGDSNRFLYIYRFFRVFRVVHTHRLRFPPTRIRSRMGKMTHLFYTVVVLFLLFTSGMLLLFNQKALRRKK